MSKAVAKKEETQVATQESRHLAAVTQAANQQEIVASDVIIPRLLLMQGISPLVMTRKAQIGELRRSTTGEKLGDPENSVDLVPLRMTNTWTNFEIANPGDKPAFRGSEPRGAIRDANGAVTGSNENWAWDFTGANGTPWIRRKTITLYALLPSDLANYEKELDRALAAGEAPDLSRTVLPVVLTFQSTSFKHAGKKCASFFANVQKTSAEMQKRGKPGVAPFNYTLPLLCKEEKGAKGMYFVYDFGVAAPLKDDAVKLAAAEWMQILLTQAVRVDEKGEEFDEAAAGSAPASEMEV